MMFHSLLSIWCKKAAVPLLLAWLMALGACSSEESVVAGAPVSHTASLTSSVNTVAREPVSSTTCGGCHQTQYDQWRQSHHFHAMQLAEPPYVLGDFSGQTVYYAGMSHRFFKQAGNYKVETENASGQLQVFTITETFGWHPLQQYLVSFADGRKQVLPFAWDARQAESGGQQWINLYPEQDIRAGDPLHWLGVYMNWNSSCASCHSTGYAKNYHADTNHFHSTFDEINVGCEGCHGNGQNHLKWVNSGLPKTTPNGGFAHTLKSGVNWVASPASTTAFPDATSHGRQLQTCGHCHSRRQDFADFSADDDFHQVHQMALPKPELYFPDGQIKDEVYVLGSFMQSKMHHVGVVCSDCHNPHTGNLKAASGNATCQQCHDGGSYGTAHTRHKAGSSGSQCVNCHMPHRTYMGVDERRDHGIRVPRPDLSLARGTPNACNQCHSDQTAQWSVNALKEWGVQQTDSLPELLSVSALRHGDGSALHSVRQMIDNSASPIVRATALETLSTYIQPRDLASVRQALADKNATVRYGAVRAASGLPATTAVAELLWPLLDDPAESVRREALHTVLQGFSQVLTAEQSERLTKKVKQMLGKLDYNAERPAAQFQRALLLTYLGHFNQAEAAYLKALTINPQMVTAMANLADLYRQQGREELALTHLHKALLLSPGNAAINHALGLALIRKGSLAEALPYLGKSVAIAPGNTQFRYVYAVALAKAGKRKEAVEQLQAGIKQSPDSIQLQQALRQHQQ